MLHAHPLPSPAAVARHYDELDPFYRALWGEHLHHGLWTRGDETPEEAVLGLVEHVARAAELGPGSRVCDIGCGYGGTARLLAGRGCRVTGLTISSVQHEHACRVGGAAGNPTFLLRDWRDNGLPEASFDAAVAIESLSHMADVPGALREAVRVLRPGGRLVLCLWLAAERTSPWEERLLLAPIIREGRLVGLPRESDYRRWAARSGLVEVEVEDASARVQRTWRLVAGQVARALGRAETWRYLLDRRRSERIFTLTVLRILLAYRRGCMRYGILRARKPAGGRPLRRGRAPPRTGR